MILTISTTHRPATDLGFLLAKHPERYQTKELSFGLAHVFYPEAGPERCTVALLLDVNSIAEIRKGNRELPGHFPLAQYVNDRPYATSSFLSTALSKVFGSALNGNCAERPELVDQPLPLEVTIASVSVRGGAHLLEEFFAPLGYEVHAERQPLDERFPDWGDSTYYRLHLRHELPLRRLLTHLYVLIPALDDRKHYFVGPAEAEKLLDKGGDWLPDHPARERIVKRFLRHRAELTQAILDQWQDSEPLAATEDDDPEALPTEVRLERPLRLHDLRHERVVAALRESGARTVLDLGCGSGKLLPRLLAERQFERITGVEISLDALERARARLDWDTLPPAQRNRLELLHGTLTYRDSRLEGYDAAALVEVIEHIDPPRIASVERAVFGAMQPQTVVVTTPNREYNVLLESLPRGQFRHKDHRFEWTREEFYDWAERVAEEFGYEVEIEGIGPEDPQQGAPSQMAVFSKKVISEES